jgi:hypothetical protein
MTRAAPLRGLPLEEPTGVGADEMGAHAHAPRALTPHRHLPHRGMVDGDDDDDDDDDDDGMDTVKLLMNLSLHHASDAK